MTSLAPPKKESPPGAPALDPTGPQVVLGGADPFNPDIIPSERSLFGPRSAFWAGPEGALYIADTGHHRVVVHQRLPSEDEAPADIVLGQPDFQTEGRNAGRDDATASTMNVPTGICRFGDGVAVADAWNNRVLIWRTPPHTSSQPADIILGQGDPRTQMPNRGLDGPRPDTMHWPFQVLSFEGRFYVADAGNRRLLGWRSLPTESGQPADFVVGQNDLTSRNDNAGGDANPSTLRWPHDLTILDGRLALSDAGNNRVLIWDDLPEAPNAAASVVIGQSDFSKTSHNQGEYWPTATAVSMPYALSAKEGGLLVADTANSRIVGFEPPYAVGMAATRLTGQKDFHTKGDNKNKLPVRDSLCWPYGLQVVGDLAVVSDTGNHRILLWRVAP